MICRMKEKDIPIVVKLADKCGFHGWDDKEYEMSIKDENRIYLSYFLGDELIGGCTVFCSYETADLCVIMVDESFRNRGVATELLIQAMALCEAKGVERMLLEVRESNRAAIGLYRKLGFGQIAVRTAYYRKPVENAIVMEKTIGSGSQ